MPQFLTKGHIAVYVESTLLEPVLGFGWNTGHVPAGEPVMDRRERNHELNKQSYWFYENHVVQGQAAGPVAPAHGGLNQSVVVDESIAFLVDNTSHEWRYAKDIQRLCEVMERLVFENRTADAHMYKLMLEQASEFHQTELTTGPLLEMRGALNKRDKTGKLKYSGHTANESLIEDQCLRCISLGTSMIIPKVPWDGQKLLNYFEKADNIQQKLMQLPDVSKLHFNIKPELFSQVRIHKQLFYKVAFEHFCDEKFGLDLAVASAVGNDIFFTRQLPEGNEKVFLGMVHQKFQENESEALYNLRLYMYAQFGLPYMKEQARGAFLRGDKVPRMYATANYVKVRCTSELAGGAVPSRLGAKDCGPRGTPFLKLQTIDDQDAHAVESTCNENQQVTTITKEDVAANKHRFRTMLSASITVGLCWVCAVLIWRIQLDRYR
jgi:hypothetical protein